MRFVQLIFSPTGGVKRVAGLLSAPMAEQPDIIDLSLPLNGTPRFSPEDVCLIAVPCFGGRVPEIALERLAQTQGGGARAILLSVYGNRSDEDTLFELKGAAMRAGYVPMAAVRAVAQHSIVPAIAAGRPDEEDARRLAQFGRVIRDRLTEPNAPPLSLAKKELLRPFGGLPCIRVQAKPARAAANALRSAPSARFQAAIPRRPLKLCASPACAASPSAPYTRGGSARWS